MLNNDFLNVFIEKLIIECIDFEVQHAGKFCSTIYIPSHYEYDKNLKHTIKVIVNDIGNRTELRAYRAGTQINRSVDDYMKIIKDRYDETTYFEDWAE